MSENNYNKIKVVPAEKNTGRSPDKTETTISRCINYAASGRGAWRDIRNIGHENLRSVIAG